MNRYERLLDFAERSHCILELGAGFNPIARKSDGWNTHIVDHATQEELRAKYANSGVNADAIEPVDTVWSSGPLDQAVPPELLGRVDILLASHVLEHLPDLIGFLQSAARLVRPGGVLSVALPDRRYCFDFYRPWTTTGDLLEAHRNEAARHSLRTAYGEAAYAVAVEGQIAWGPGPVPPPALVHPFSVAAAMARDYGRHTSAPYQDFHAWQFTPASFRLLMVELRALGLSDWLQDNDEHSEGTEFITRLRRAEGQQAPGDPATLQERRQALLLHMMHEVREQVDAVLGSAPAAPVSQSGPGADYQALVRRLDEQGAQLREIINALAAVRHALGPLRRVWRLVRLRAGP